MRVGALLVGLAVVAVGCGDDDCPSKTELQNETISDRLVDVGAVLDKPICPERSATWDPYWEQGVQGGALGDCSECYRYKGAQVTSCTVFPVCRTEVLGLFMLKQFQNCSYVNYCG